MPKPPKKYAPQIPFPPYTYVPGLTPHPVNNPKGHSYGVDKEPVDDFDPQYWRESAVYLHGIDLFNHGYYWEAHETWEELWIACGRIGQTADFIKGLIKLAAAGVKVRSDIPQGVQKLARDAAIIFYRISNEHNSGFMGLNLNDLLSFARGIAQNPPIITTETNNQVIIVFDFFLQPTDS